MKPKFTLLLFMMLMLSASVSRAQVDQNTIINDGPQHPTLILQGEMIGISPSLESQVADGTFKPAVNEVKEVNPKRWGANISVPGKGLPVGEDPLLQQQMNAPQNPGRAPLLTFEAASATATPSDPTGAVGPNHFVNSWNSAFRIWDKAGNPLTAAASLGTILPGTMGDPIVIYDRYADRFLITEFYANGFDVAISQGPNPVTSGWYIYRFATSSFPDYPKFSVWSDGYYITSNKNSGTAGTSQVVFALDRSRMLSGLSATMLGFPLPGIVTSGFYSPLAFNANGPTPPPAGNVPIVYMQDDSWSGVSSDHIKLWSVNVNWTTPASSTISSPQIIPTSTPFDGLFDGGSFSNLPQPSPGGDIDALQATMMFMAQYRRFPTYNAAVMNFVVDLNGADNYAGIRWFEMRQTTDGAPWYIFQEGTYSAPGGVSAFCGTMCIDAFGNIGLSYTTVSTSQFPSLRFTGRYSTDPPGVMTLAEQSFASGTQIDPATRYGDYAQMTVDPNDDATFWAIGEYFNGGRKNQVGVFKIQPLITVANFSASTTTPAIGQTVTFSDLSTLSPTSWSWSFSPGTVTFVGGTTANSQNPQVTFNAVGSYTVTLTATNSGGSDSEIKTNYISAGYCIPAYTSGAGAGDYISLVQLGSINNSTGGTPYPSYTYYSGLSTDLARVSSQTITVSAGSYFSSNYISVWIDFDHNGVFSSAENLGTVLLEAAPATGSISFTVPASAVLGTTRMRVREVYAISNPDPCSTYVYGEAEDYNVNITPIQYCTPTYSYGTSYGDFISYVQLETINNSTGAAGFPYYTYFSSMSANLTAGAEYTIALTAGTFAFNNNISVWIDYDLNGLFDEYEKLGNVVLEAAPSTGYITFTVPGNAIVGETRMRVREAYVNSNMDACSLNSFGETEDYNINILPLQYCTPEYIYGSGDGDYISLVALGSIYNASGATPFPYYTYYNSLSTNLDAGSTYTLTLSPGTYTSGNYLAAWIDYNYNGLFEDTEKLGNILVDPTPATGTITFTVPGITLSGTTRMRVREVYGDYNMSSCNLASFGETEDYPVHISNSNKILNLTVYLQGLYAGGGTMNQASSGSGPQFPGTTADQISVELHNALTYSLIEFSNPFVNLNTNGSAVVLIPSFFSGSYYVTIRHRNSIETTTATPVSFLAPSLNYAFNLQSKAYGNNLFATSDGRYLIYAGDVDQDGIVDSSDMIPADNDVSTFVTGYVVTDINGDGLVDSSDMILIDNNSGNFIGTVLP